jgi:uncharacterized protein YutE (UPF0331/DUF86 family)
MRLNLWKQAQEMETIILHLESRIDNLESILASVLKKPQADANWISKMKEKELLDKKARQRVYARNAYLKKKAKLAAQKEAK